MMLIQSEEVMPCGVPPWTRIAERVNVEAAVVSGILPEKVQGLLIPSRPEGKATGGAHHRSWSDV